MSNELQFIREEIDKVDRELSRLLEKRMALVTKVAEYKKQNGTEILDTSREKQVIENVLSVVTSKEYAESIQKIFEYMMAVSKEFQKGRLKSSQPKRYAVIGEKLSHSLSPEIHRLFFEKTGISGTYELMELPPDEVPGLLTKLYSEGYAGINVTIPYKTEIMKYVASLSDEAMRVSAVNTVKICKECEGHNTDYFGFGKALEFNNVTIAGKTCAVLGSGGSSRAVTAYLEDHGASTIAIVTRDTEAASIKYPKLQCINIADFSAEGFDLIINTTPVGMWPKTGVSPLRRDQIRGASFIMDLIYNPKETELMQLASQEGIPCANGLYMLVAQAVCAQEIWQQRTFERALIDDIYEDINAL